MHLSKENEMSMEKKWGFREDAQLVGGSGKRKVGAANRTTECVRLKEGPL